MTIIPLIFGLGWWEVVLIALVILLLFGGRKIPELLKSIGRGIKNFRTEVKSDGGTDNSVDEQGYAEPTVSRKLPKEKNEDRTK